MLCSFLFHIEYTIYATHVLIKTIMSNKTSDLDTFGSDGIFVQKVFAWGKSSHVLIMNKPQLVSFFVYRRHSRDRFRINA